MKITIKCVIGTGTTMAKRIVEMLGVEQSKALGTVFKKIMQGKSVFNESKTKAMLNQRLFHVFRSKLKKLVKAAEQSRYSV